MNHLLRSCPSASKGYRAGNVGSNRPLFLCLLGVLAISGAMPAQASLLFSDGFQSDTVGGVRAPGSLMNWNVNLGSVEVYGPGNKHCQDPDPNAQCLTLRRMGSPSGGGIESIPLFSLPPDDYLLTFTLTGTLIGSGPPDRVTVSLGDIYLEVFAVPVTQPPTVYTRTIHYGGAPTSGKLSFQEPQGNDNSGAILDNVQLDSSSVPAPEPSTLSLLAIGFVVMFAGLWRRPEHYQPWRRQQSPSPPKTDDPATARRPEWRLPASWNRSQWMTRVSPIAVIFVIALYTSPLHASLITSVPGPVGSWGFEFGAHQTLQGGFAFPIPAHGSDSGSFSTGPNLSAALATYDYSQDADKVFIGGWTNAVALLVQDTGEGFGAEAQLDLINLRYRIDPGPGENIGDPVTLYASLVAIEHGFAHSRNLEAGVQYGLHSTDPNGQGAGSTLTLHGTQIDGIGQSIHTSNTVPFTMLVGDELSLFVVSNGSANGSTSPYVNGQDFHFQLSFSPVPPEEPAVMLPAVPEPATAHLFALGGLILVLTGRLYLRRSQRDPGIVAANPGGGSDLPTLDRSRHHLSRPTT